MLIPALVIAVSLTAGLLYLWLRRYESARGVRFFETVRAQLDQRAAEFWRGLVEGGVPIAWRRIAVALVHEATHALVKFAVELIRTIERPLARLSYKLRVSAPKTGSAPVSEFLRTITPERK